MSEPAGRWPERLALPAVVALAVVFSLHRLEDFDIWYHLAAGRLVWTTGRWPTVNGFAFTAPDHPWIDLHWLFQLALYASWMLGGPNGGIVLTAALVLATSLVLYRLARRFVRPVPAALLLAVALTIAIPRINTRPELASFLLFALYLALLETSGRSLWLLVPLQIVWVNTEGLFALGLVLIACYWTGATLARLSPLRDWWPESRLAPAAWRRLGAVLVLATLACLVNPYGLRGALFPLELLPRVTGGSFLSTRIGEFRGPFASGYAPPLTWTWLVLLVASGVVLLLDVRRWRLGRTLAVVAVGVLSTQSIRNMTFFGWMAVPALAAHGRSAFAGLGGRLRRLRPVFEWGGLAAMAVLAGIVVTNQLSRALGLERAFGLGLSRVRFPMEAVRFLADTGIAGRPFNCLAMGGLLDWSRAPEQTFVDGRLEAFPEDFLRTYFGVMDDPRGWPVLAETYRFDYAFLFHVWGNRLPLAAYLAGGHGWTLVYYDPIASIFVPADEAHREVRERAQRAFASLTPADGPAATHASGLVVPVEEAWRGKSLGYFVAMLGDYPRAVRIFSRTLDLDPDDTEIRYALGLAQWRAGQPDAAVREWREILRREPANQAAQRALSQTGR